MSRALGRYELLRPLARGGMAEVYLARRRAAGVEKWLVVKRIRAERAGDVRFLDLFVREARLSMSLAHQNIVPVFDFGRIDDQVFLAMERVEGRDLGSTLARTEGHAPPLIAAFIAAECCQALDYAHRRKGPDGTALGIVHRDVTPRNVLLSWSGEVKLTDFGIAALAGDATTQLLGTPAYMAPEQARGEPLDARADVYAVGLVLRELLTGDRARPGTARDELVNAARSGELIPWPDETSAALRAIVDRATALDPDARYPDARAMLAELDMVIVSERAARKSESPARLLAAWLDDAWAGARDDDDGDGEVEGDHLVSFLDDGALDVIGTGTARSLAGTAADEPGDAPAAEPVIAPPPEPAAKAEPPHHARARIVVAAAATLALLVLGVVGLTREPAPRAVAPAPPIASSDPPPVMIPSPPPRPTTPAVVTPDAPTVAVAVDEPRRPEPVHSRTEVLRRGSSAPTKAAVGSGSDAPRAGSAARTVTRKVTINAIPWAYFTVGDDPARHETIEVLQLAPGKHQLHFTNPVLEISREVTIDVPADRDLTVVERLN